MRISASNVDPRHAGFLRRSFNDTELIPYTAVVLTLPSSTTAIPLKVSTQCWFSLKGRATDNS
jgi:hypothetical protein